MPMTLHPAALRAQVASLAGAMSADDPHVIAFHGDLAWTGGDSLQVGDRGWQVRSCRSSLEVREVLAYRDADAGPLVILTPLSHADLGVDVVARLHNGPGQGRSRTEGRRVDAQVVRRGGRDGGGGGSRRT